ncbi:MAG: hypothetical protein J6J18_01905 [Oscillospiraceae bacterium]|nr:hypothetical protein [Oscillospiraceae bacterium]
MNRNEIMEKLTQAANQMDDKTLEMFAGLAEVSIGKDYENELAEINERIEKNEQAASEKRRQRREERLTALTPKEGRIWNKIQQAKKRICKTSRADLTLDEADFLIDLSCGGPQLISDAYYLGFEKGYTAGKKTK